MLASVKNEPVQPQQAPITQSAIDRPVDHYIAYRAALGKGRFETAGRELDRFLAKSDWATAPLRISEKLEWLLAKADYDRLLAYLSTVSEEPAIVLLSEKIQDLLLNRLSEDVNRELLLSCLDALLGAHRVFGTDPELLRLYLSAVAPSPPPIRYVTALWSFSDAASFPEAYRPLVEEMLTRPKAHARAVVDHFLTQLRYGRYDYIITTAPPCIKRFPEDDARFKEVRQVYFRALMSKRRYTRLIEILEYESTRRIYRVNPVDGETMILSLWLRKGQLNRALEVLSRMKTAFSVEELTDAYLYLADFHFQRRQYVQSRRYYETVRDRSPSIQTMVFIQWRLSRIYHAVNDPSALKEVFSWADEFHFDNNEVAARFCYWGVKLNAYSGRQPLTCYQRYPLTYYGYRALLSSSGKSDASLFPAVKPRRNQPLSDSERSFLEIVSQLYQYGEETVADRLVRRYVDRHPELSFFIHLSRVLHRHQRYYLQQLLVAIHFDHHLRSPGWTTAVLLPAYYPVGYQQAVTRYAKADEVPEPLIYAVIREESNFRPDVSSTAGAIGLMQLMPATAVYVGETIRLKVNPRQLTDPDLNVRLGVSYLKRLLRRYKGNLYYTLAAYNGGPTNVRRWRQKAKGGDIDQFVESIPFDETRAYVKRVMRSYFIYQKIYEQSI